MNVTPTDFDPMESLLRILELSDAGGAQTDEDIFIGLGDAKAPRARLFGGQVLAQSLVAAARTVGGDHLVHSMHGYFLRPGEAASSLTFGVQRLRDGRSFSARRTHAYQGGVPILSMISSFQKPDSGIEHQEPMPQGIPAPETLPTSAQLLGGIDHPVARAWAYERPFDIRHVENDIYFDVKGEHVAHTAVWLKTLGPMPEDQNLHRAALAYASDYTLLEPSLRRHGISWATPGISVASLDHAMWWHRPLAVDDWLLYVAESPSASEARGLNLGRFYNRDGVLVASVAQEGMMRIPDGTAAD
ncbi:acyl-CoA thioesterase [Arthrobacter psychrochitiniphilus]|uniref:Acyl-CoA thioesterase 2 n=1 Tax=Arthrobacter psychrochitiniphilus TaxID=291045 RepID=A0A2V3DQV4_9MICC|nr:acyl-CoA thioesterase II [Arthrobacter psychrochitiniphilus]NYG17823.1 acyl-CoA thioesterase-2 [Arthrobacter psychrochitiniphilus]PXA65137.1 acyl-CoA thioesterase II [Arthrobacter psychrochitiniphilus]